MPYDDLRAWIVALERAGELRHLQTEADPILEIAEITDRVSKSATGTSRVGTAAPPAPPSAARGSTPGGSALLFENVKGHPGAKVLINQFGSESRMKLALGVDSLDEIADRIRVFMDVKSPQGILDKIKMLPMLAEMGKFFPKTVPTGPCKEVIQRDNFSLLDFPILQCWPQDAGRFITLPCVVTRDPKTGKRNVGMYRMQVYDERTTGMHWQRQKIGAEHYRESIRRSAVENEGCEGPDAARAAVSIMARTSGGSVLAPSDHPAGKMQVAVAIGTDPAVTFSAIVPAPPDVEEYLIAGFLRGAPLNWLSARPSILKCRPAVKSSSKATSTLTNCAPKAPSATTPASTRSRISIPSSMSLASRTARIPFTPPPLSVSRRRKMRTWARPSSASFSH